MNAEKTTTNYYGYMMHSFSFEGNEVILVEPKQKTENNPWVWRAEFFGAFDYADRALLEQNFYVIYYNLSNKFGSSDAVSKMKKFKDYIVNHYNLSQKADIFGFSRGGLYSINYTAMYPQDVSVLYLDAPVLDLKSWPLGMKKGTKSERDVELCKKEFNVDNICDITYSPINKLDELNNSNVPIIMVYGDSDDIVPYEENGLFLEKNYKNIIKIIRKNGIGHHPHSLEDPTIIVDFIKSFR